MNLAIVIPAYNEEKTIESVVLSVKPYGFVVVVNDKSTDNTASLAKAVGAVVITHEKQMGYDGALNSGFAKAIELGCTHIITFDADGQHPVKLIEDFIQAFADGNELLLGARHIHQRFSEVLFSYYSRFRFGINDPLCGMKGYTSRLAIQQGCFDSYKSIGTELAFRSLSSGAKFKQISFESLPRTDGAPRFSSTIKANLKILRALYKSIFIK